MNNPWHEVHYGSKAPEVVNAIIEIPKGSKGKFELDKDTGLIKLDRVLFSSVHYPANYGFIPQTYCEDGDPLDILVLTSVELPPMCLIQAMVVGVMRMLDQGFADDKIIAVAVNDIGFDHIQKIGDLPPHTMMEVRRFFEDYKKLENKEVLVKTILGKEEAYAIIEEGISLYRNEIRKERVKGITVKSHEAERVDRKEMTLWVVLGRSQPEEQAPSGSTKKASAKCQGFFCGAGGNVTCFVTD